MRKLFLGLALIAGAGFALAQPPVVPPTPPVAPAVTTEFFPLKEGSKWVYKVGEAEVTVVVGATANGETKLETQANGKPVASESVKLNCPGSNSVTSPSAAQLLSGNAASTEPSAVNGAPMMLVKPN